MTIYSDYFTLVTCFSVSAEILSRTVIVALALFSAFYDYCQLQAISITFYSNIEPFSL